MPGLLDFIGHTAAGAIEGYGMGMAKDHEMAEEERRQVALEKLRRQHQSEDNVQRSDLNDRNAARQTAREADVSTERDYRQAGLDQEKDDRRFQQRLTEMDLNFANQRDMARLQSSLSVQEQAAINANRATIENTENGLVLVYGDGKVRDLGIKAPPAASGGGGSSVLAAARGGTATAASTPAPAANSPEVRYDPQGKAYVRGPDGNPKRAPQYDRN